jgi:hypothetical protein
VPKGGDHTDTRTQDPRLLATLMYQGWEASRYKEPRRLTIKRNAMRGRDREKATTQIVDVRSSDVAVMNGCTRYTPSTMRPACDVVLLSRMFEELLSIPPIPFLPIVTHGHRSLVVGPGREPGRLRAAHPVAHVSRPPDGSPADVTREQRVATGLMDSHLATYAPAEAWSSR